MTPLTLALIPTLKLRRRLRQNRCNDVQKRYDEMVDNCYKKVLQHCYQVAFEDLLFKVEVKCIRNDLNNLQSFSCCILSLSWASTTNMLWHDKLEFLSISDNFALV
jgi:hypothetical protein